MHFQIRMRPALHERLASSALDKKTSLNATVVALLTEAVERRRHPGGPNAAWVSGPARVKPKLLPSSERINDLIVE